VNRPASDSPRNSGDGERISAAPPTGNSWRAQQADALVAMAKAYLSGGNGSVKGSSAADHYQVVIHTDASALRGGGALRGGISVDNSALHRGGALHGVLARSDLPIETVRRLTCDGSLVTIIEDPEGTPLDVGRKRRTVTTALKRALWSRDRHCSFPGCHNRCHVDAHHIEHWAGGGETSLENLTLLCTFHHTLLHEGGFKIKRDSEGAIYFQRRPSMDARPSTEVLPWATVNTSTEVSEVREPAAIYYLRADHSRA
jgi:hypothetical protein